MRSRRPNLLVVLYVLAVALCAAVFGMSESSPDAPPYAAWGLGLALASMMGTWLVGGAGPFLFRLTVSLVCLGILAAGLERITRVPTFGEIFGVATLMCVLTALFSAVLWWVGYGWVRESAEPDVGWNRERPQFTLGGLFAATTISGIFLAGVRWMEFPWDQGVEVLVLMFTLFSVSAVAQLMAGWGCLGAILVPILYALAVLFPQFQTLSVAVPYSITIGLWIWTMHVAGYRWVQRQTT